MLRLPDETLLLGLYGYDFIGRRCRELGVDVFETRIMLQRTICMMGAEATRVFYDGERFQRAGAAPRRLKATLLGKQSVQGLDGRAHHERKGMFMQLMAPPRLAEIAERVTAAWEAVPAGRQQLLTTAQTVLTRAACAWAGVPLPEEDVAKRRDDLTALIESPASVGPGYWRGRVARVRTERWLREVLADAAVVRAGQDRAVGVFAALPRDVGAVELCNVVRPIVAISRYLVFCALALHEYPEAAPVSETERGWFVDEVRRFYPFFPAVVARVKTPFTWSGVEFRRGDRAMLDLYGTNHDARIWRTPDQFLPMRFATHDGASIGAIPQGGGTHDTGHRCAGELLTREVMAATTAFLQRASYRVPPQDLSVSLRKVPAIPASGFVVEDLRPGVAPTARGVINPDRGVQSRLLSPGAPRRGSAL